MSFVWVLAAIFIATLAGVGAFRFIAMRSGWMDVPNHRSSHERAVPRGAGIVFVLVWAAAIYINYLLDGRSGNLILILLLVAMIGAADDAWSLSPYLRFVGQFVCAFSVLVFLDGLLPLVLWQGVELGNSNVLGGLAVIGMVWMLNLYNFMDGADGLAAAEGIFVACAGGAVLYQAGDTVLVTWLAYLAACLAGFFVWNVSPAKVFMGDVGSYFIGFFLAIIALVSHNSGLTHIWFWLILLAVFAVDATVTLVRRALTDQRVFSAHRTHAYQHLMQRWGSHNQVVASVMAVNLLWLLPLALLSQAYPNYAFVITGIAYLPLVILAVLLRAGLPHVEKSVQAAASKTNL